MTTPIRAARVEAELELIRSRPPVSVLIRSRVRALFPSATAETRDALGRDLLVMSFARHDYLVRQGEPAMVLAILTGNVAVRTGDLDGRRLTLGIMGPGDVVGLMSASRFVTSRDDVVGLMPGTWMAWPGRRVRRLMRADAGLGADCFDLAMEYLARFEELLTQTTFEGARERFARVLLDYEGLICRPGAVLSRAELASLVGVTREMIGVVTRDLEADGLIARDGAVIRILDRPAIEALYPGDARAIGSARIGVAGKMSPA
jgi:CRP/FNR family transcriptional regulator, cyclic AMP receptor protein